MIEPSRLELLLRMIGGFQNDAIARLTLADLDERRSNVARGERHHERVVLAAIEGEIEWFERQRPCRLR